MLSLLVVGSTLMLPATSLGWRAIVRLSSPTRTNACRSRNHPQRARYRHKYFQCCDSALVRASTLRARPTWSPHAQGLAPISFLIAQTRESTVTYLDAFDRRVASGKLVDLVVQNSMRQCLRPCVACAHRPKVRARPRAPTRGWINIVCAVAFAFAEVASSHLRASCLT